MEGRATDGAKWSWRAVAACHQRFLTTSDCSCVDFKNTYTTVGIVYSS